MTRTINPMDLAAMPTIGSGHTADLKIDTGCIRVWRSRMTIADGETEPIQIEELHNGRWVDVCPHGYAVEIGGIDYMFDGPGRVKVQGHTAPCYDQGIAQAHVHRRGRYCK